jgi:hypothetical protein
VNVTYIRASEPKPKQSIPIEPLKETPKDDFNDNDDFELKPVKHSVPKGPSEKPIQKPKI